MPEGQGKTRSKIETLRGILCLVLFTISTLLISAPLIVIFQTTGMAMERTTIGVVEDVVLMPWGIRVTARVDTGAATSSLDAQDIVIKDGMVSFKLPERCGGRALRLSLLNVKEIKTSGMREKRPVVSMELCIGQRRLKARVNLNDRSDVKYPMILGRNVLTKNFFIDPSKEHHVYPVCPEICEE